MTKKIAILGSVEFSFAHIVDVKMKTQNLGAVDNCHPAVKPRDDNCPQPLPIEEILEYKNQHVLERYSKDFHTTSEQAQECFIEMLKFLWISEKNNTEKKLNSSLNAFIVMHHEMIEIDNMWHTFILFTRDYYEFCIRYFGHYLHHQPTTSGDSIPTEEEFENQLKLFLEYVYDNLGEITLYKWFAEYF